MRLFGIVGRIRPEVGAAEASTDAAGQSLHLRLLDQQLHDPQHRGGVLVGQGIQQRRKPAASVLQPSDQGRARIGQRQSPRAGVVGVRRAFDPALGFDRSNRIADARRRHAQACSQLARAQALALGGERRQQGALGGMQRSLAAVPPRLIADETRQPFQADCELQTLQGFGVHAERLGLLILSVNPKRPHSCLECLTLIRPFAPTCPGGRRESARMRFCGRQGTRKDQFAPINLLKTGAAANRL